MSIKQKLTVLDDFSKTFDIFNKKAKQADKSTKSMDGSLKKMDASATSSFASIAAGAVSFAAVTNYIMKGVKANNWLVESDKRLETIARSVTKATDSQIDSLRALADATELRTAQEAEAVKVGHSQLLSFGMSTKSAEKLNGAMSDLAAAQFGLGVKGRDLIGVANMLGKAYQGMDGAISRAGVTMTDAQKQALKLGNESERVAVISEVIAQNFGGLAEALKNTDAGKIEMMKHDMGTLQETLTAGLLPVFGELAEYISDSALEASEASEEFNLLGMGVAAISSVAIGTIAVVQTLGNAFAKAGIQAALGGVYMKKAYDADRVREYEKEIVKLEKIAQKNKGFGMYGGLENVEQAERYKELKANVASIESEMSKTEAIAQSLRDSSTEIDTSTLEKLAKSGDAINAVFSSALDKRKQLSTGGIIDETTPKEPAKNSDANKALAAEISEANAMELRRIEYIDSLNEQMKENRLKSAEDTFQKERAMNQEQDDWIASLETFAAERSAEYDAKKIESDKAAKDSMIQSAFEVSASIQSIASSNSSIRLAEISREEEAIRKSTMSDKQKAKAIEELEKKRRAETLKSAKVNAAFAMSMSLATTALTIGKSMEAIADVTAKTPGGPMIKLAAGSAIAASLIGVVSQAKSAQASIAGAREFGGGTMAGNSYEIGERGKPEVIENASGKFIFNPSQASKVTPIADSGMGSKVINAYFNVYESRDANVTAKTIVTLLNQVDRDGSMDWGGMKNLKRAVA